MQSHESPQTERRFIISLFLTGLIFLAELIGGWWTGSLALLSDAAHVFLDVFALGLSYTALRLSARPVNDRHTYGYHRLEVLAALANGLTLAFISITIFREAWGRWLTPQEVKSGPMMVIAVVGLVVNLVVALVLRGDSHQHAGEAHVHNDLNVESAFLHVVGDAISSVGVIVAAIIIGLTQWEWVDPLMSVFIGLIILFSSVRVLRNSLHILIEGVPEGLSIQAVADTITNTPGVSEVHDLHVWSVCSGRIALSAHVTLQAQPPDSGLILMELQRRLKADYGIQHSTIQIEKQLSDSVLIQVD